LLADALGKPADAGSIAAEDLATMSEAPLTPEQVEAARELVGWTRGRLAFRAGVSEKTVLTFESGGPIDRAQVGQAHDRNTVFFALRDLFVSMGNGRNS
jgi:DNA-binding XRE family transcriptional regulator